MYAFAVAVVNPTTNSGTAAVVVNTVLVMVIAVFQVDPPFVEYSNVNVDPITDAR